MNNYTFGNYICGLREKKGLSQAELGKILGVSNKAVSKWETGASYPSTELMFPLAKALGITIEELYTAVNQSKQPPTKLRRLLNTVFGTAKIWLPVLWSIALVCYLVYLIFGRPEQKMTLAIASPISAIIVYVFGRVLFYILSKNPMCPGEFLDLLETLFFCGFSFTHLQSILLFVTDIPNGFSFFFFVSCGSLLALAQVHLKRMK